MDRFGPRLLQKGEVMQEEFEKKTVAFVMDTAKFTSDELFRAVKQFLELGIKKTGEKDEPTGEMTVGELVSKGGGAKTIEIDPKEIATFRQVAMKYEVDFAVKKNLDEKDPKFLVFFQGKDEEVITNAFKEYVYEVEKNKTRESTKKKLSEKKKKVEIDKTKRRDKEKHKNRDISR